MNRCLAFLVFITANVLPLAVQAADENTLRTNCFSGRDYNYDPKVIMSSCEELLKMPSLDKVSRVEAYNILGLVAANTDQTQAIRYYEEGLKIDPDYRWLLQNKAYALYILQKCPESFSFYEKAAKASPENYVALFGMGEALSCQGKFKESLPFYTDAVTYGPHLDSYYRQKARHELIAGDPKKAIEDMEAAVRLNKDENIYTYQAALVAYLAGDLEKAAKWIDENRKRAPNDTYGLLALHFIRLAQKGSAKAEIEKGIASAAKEGWGVQLLRRVLDQLTDDQLLQAARNANKDTENAQLVDFYFYTGELALTRGDRALAAERFRATVSTPGSRNYMEYWIALARLRTLAK